MANAKLNGPRYHYASIDTAPVIHGSSNCRGAGSGSEEATTKY